MQDKIGYDASPDEQKRFIEHWIDREILYLNARKHLRNNDPEMRVRLKEYKKELTIADYNDRFIRQQIFIDESDVLSHYQKYHKEYTADRPAVFVNIYTGNSSEAANDILSALKKESRPAVPPTLKLLRQGDCVDAIDRALFLKNSPSLIGPIYVDGKYFVFSVIERYELNSQFHVEHVREDIIQRLHIEEYMNASQQKLKDLKERYNVKIFKMPD